MKKQHGFVTLAVLSLLVLFVAGCDSPKPAVVGGQVKASSAYIEAFGQPPVPKQGECLARVGYYPLRSAPGGCGRCRSSCSVSAIL